MYRLVFIFLAFTFFSASGQAKKFKTSYLEFELPDKWQCDLHKTAFLCRHRISKTCQADRTAPECKTQIRKSREALIVISAKEKSNLDSLSAFSGHFGEAKKFNAAVGSTQSKVVHNKTVSIKKLKWVDGMHLGSELPHYYTRYLATINGKVAVLVSFTAHKRYYTNYSTQFFKGIKSLNVTTKNLNDINKNELGNRLLSRPIDIPDELLETSAMAESPQEDGVSTLLFILSMVLAAAGLFIWLKSKKRP